MPRISRYEQPVKQNSKSFAWNTALYIRLSREDGDKEESDSIGNQRDLLLDYVNSSTDLSVFDTYIDDGFSGTSFDRPEFQRMMSDIKQKKVNCVMVKDLSRFGRNYIEVGNYIEQIFPFLDVRFISVNDILDSFKNPNQMNNIIVPFKNLINDEYCRDISIKIRSQLDLKRKKGDFIGSFAPYGYFKDKANKSKLVVDEYAASVIRDIFKWFIEGESQLGIAKKLNDKGIVNPTAYKISLGYNCNKNFNPSTHQYLWCATTVKRILANKVYLGHMQQHKTKVKSYKVQKIVGIPEEDWIVVENTHEPIIDEAIFLNVQDIMKRDTRTSPNHNKVYPFSGYLKCADCGRGMNKKNISQPYADYSYYVCSTYKKMSKSICTKHTIRSDKLENAVLSTLQKQIELAIDAQDLIMKITNKNKVNYSVRKVEEQIANHEKELFKISSYKKSLYEDWKNGDITRDEYLEFKQKYDDELNTIEDILNKLKQEKLKSTESFAEENTWLTNFKKYQNIESITREMVVELIDTVLIHEGGKITIKFKFADEFQRLCDYIEENKHIIAE